MAGINNLNGLSNMSSLLSGMTGTSDTNNWQSNTISSLFGGNTNTSSSSGTLGIDFSSLSSIKNGSYYKMLKKYYNSNASVDSNSDDLKKYQAKVDKMANASADLSKSLNEVINAGDYSADKRDDLLKKVQSFVDDYNKTIDNAADSDSKSVLQKAKWLTNMTSQYSNVLSEIGISVGQDNKLKVNEEAFQKADAASLESVLGSNPNSYTNKVLYKAEQLYSLSKTYGSSATAYTSAGTYKPDTATTPANIVDTLL